jgi:hypothetical protein
VLVRVLGPNTFLDRLATVRSKTGVKIGRHAGEIAQSFEIRTALEVALIE